MNALMNILTIALLWTNGANTPEVEKENTNASPNVAILNTKGLPIISGTINGDTVYFVVDTGAGMTLLDLNQIKRLGFGKSRRQKGQLSGLGGRSTELWWLRDAIVEIGGQTISRLMMGVDLNNIVSEVRQQTGYKISGIIGTDVMRQYGFTIDYANQICLIHP